MKISDHGINLICSFEGFRSMPYICPGGKVTIGYGHVVHHKETYPYPQIPQDLGRQILAKDVSKFEEQLKSVVKVPLTQNQYDALVSLIFNVGISAFKKSKFLKKLNNKDYEGAATEFDDWVHAGGKRLDGLVKRRRMEKDLFLGR
jgi:lysozyme